MNAQERQEFLNNRKTGIGGSDIASLLQPYLQKEVKYGCQRKLWLDKSGIPADYPQDDSGPMRLGRILEPVIAEWHMEATGDILSEIGTIRHPNNPELLVNIDREVQDRNHDTTGAGEIKALGPEMFYKTKRDGIIVDYELQVQHGMLCRGLSWGKFIVGNRAYGHDIKNPPLAWCVDRNLDIHEAITAVGARFWATLGDEEKAPKRLEPDDKRCGTCQWRQGCQGGIFRSEGETGDKDKLPYADDLRPLLTEYVQVKERFEQEESLYEDVKERIKEAVGVRAGVAIRSGGKKDHKIYFRAQDGRTSWETADMLLRYEKMRDQLRPADPSALDAFNEACPPGEFFKRQGLPFRVLRVYP